MGSFTRLLNRVVERVRFVAWMVASRSVFLATGNQVGDDTVATLMFIQMGDQSEALVSPSTPPVPD